MAAAFLGKWKVDLTTISGLDEFGAALGLSAERIETYRKLDYSIEFTSSGDEFTANVNFEGGIPAKSYSFKLGDPFDYTSMDGLTSKLTITEDGGKLVESYKNEEKNIEWQTTRELDGDVMTATTSAAGKSMTQKLNKL